MNMLVDNNIATMKLVKSNKQSSSTLAICLLACFAVLTIWSSNKQINGALDYDEYDEYNEEVVSQDVINRRLQVYPKSYHKWNDNVSDSSSNHNYVRRHASLGRPGRESRELLKEKHSMPLQICSRAAPISHEYDLEIFTKYANKCQSLMETPKEETSVLLLDGLHVFGRAGNNFIEFFHALQFAQDHTHSNDNVNSRFLNDTMIVGIMSGSWAIQLIQEFSFAIQDDNLLSFKEMFELAFCVKIFDNESELKEYKQVKRVDNRDTTRDMFLYSPLRTEEGDEPGSISKTGVKLQSEYVEYQTHLLRTFWRSYNTGVGVDMHHNQVQDMCSVVDKMYPQDRKKNKGIKYTVIHSRSLEGEPGKLLLKRIAVGSGCDDRAALDMEPSYIKSILKETDMLGHPVLFITDHQRPEILQKLRDDPDIGPNIRLIPDEVSWVGGDITAAVMSSVFIGNPASTLSGFIAKSRVALGYTDNYLFRKRKDRLNEWKDVRTPVEIFDRRYMGSMN